MMIIKPAFLVIAACVLCCAGVNAQGKNQGVNTANTEAAVLRHDYPQVAAVAHVRCDEAQAVQRIGGYVTYRVPMRVVESFKGRLRKGQKAAYYAMAESSYPARFYRGDKIVFLNIVRAKGKWVYSALENSTHSATTQNLAVMRQLRVGSDALQQVKSFLNFHLAHADGLNPPALQLRKRWLEPKLYALLQREIQREAVFRAQHPHEVPFISGDVFTTSQENPSGFRLAAATRQKDVATVPVRFQFGPDRRTVNYQLRLRQEQWLLEDIVFGGESLLKTLQRPSYAEIADPLQQIAQSHIKGNVPSPPNFDAFLRRDLLAYFKPSMGKTVAVDYDLLRREPTQSGVSLPKYYLWVKIYRGKNLVEEGAARVAAMEQKQFEVTDYFSKSDLAKHPQQIDATFPTLIGDKIRSRIGRK